MNTPLETGKTYTISMRMFGKRQLVRGIYLRTVPFLFFWERHEFLFNVHTTDHDTYHEYDTKQVLMVKDSEILGIISNNQK
jgi:hypothetical protein